jgi:hypothetical protein
LSPTAADDLAKLKKPLRNHVVEHLSHLAKKPSSLSRAAVFPYPPSQQISHAPPLEHEGNIHHFVVLFRYGQDEESLHIVGIGHHFFASD